MKIHLCGILPRPYFRTPLYLLFLPLNAIAMDTPFVFDKHVSGKNFIGRKKDRNSLANLLRQGEHVSLWAPPGSGKMSLLQQTFLDLKLSGTDFTICSYSALNDRSAASFLCGLGDSVIRTVAQAGPEYKAVIDGHLVQAGFRYSEEKMRLSLDHNPGKDEINAIFSLPWTLAAKSGTKITVVLEEFQNVWNMEDPESLLRHMEECIAAFHEGGDKSCQYVFMGSRVNAMKEIFARRKYFYRLVEHYPLSPFEEKDITEHIIRGFQAGGKVIERELIPGICSTLGYNMKYINNFIFICDSLSKGYISELTLSDALSCVMAENEPRFLDIMFDLTTFQIQLLKAILDGVTKFSTTEVIERYGLNSSANVKRLKDALIKKEVVEFDENDEPHLLDPLFEYWLRNKYFKI